MPGTVSIADAGATADTVPTAATLRPRTSASFVNEIMGALSPLRALDGSANRRDGLRDDQIDAEPAELGAGPPRIALHAAGLAGCGLCARCDAHQTRLERQGERGVREPGVLADLLGAVAPRLQQRVEPGRRRAIVLLDRMHASRRRRPLAVQPSRGVALRGLGGAVISEHG